MMKAPTLQKGPPNNITVRWFPYFGCNEWEDDYYMSTPLSMCVHCAVVLPNFDCLRTKAAIQRNRIRILIVIRESFLQASADDSFN